MNIESRLALEILSESKISSYNRRFKAVTSFIERYGLVPTFERIIEGLPKNDSIRKNVLPAQSLSEEIQLYEGQIKGDCDLTIDVTKNASTINILDNLYDRDYRLSK